MLGMIWAQSRNGVIGRDGGLPWRIPEDLAHFRRSTGTDAVIHGRRSWEALPSSFRPLPGRRNIVVSRRAGYQAAGAEVVGSLYEALDTVAGADAWICGGGQVYVAAMGHADRLLVTMVDAEVDGDTHAPTIEPAAWDTPIVSEWVQSRAGHRFQVLDYRRPATSGEAPAVG